MTMPPDPWTLPVWAGDLTDIIAAALDLLRLEASDVDAARMETLAGAAVRRIDDYLDYSDGMGQPYPPPPELFDAAVQVTVRLYKSKDAPFGTSGGWSEFDGGPFTVPSDVLASVRHLIVPLKAGWGVG